MHFDALKMGCFRNKRVFQQYRSIVDVRVVESTYKNHPLANVCFGSILTDLHSDPERPGTVHSGSTPGCPETASLGHIQDIPRPQLRPLRAQSAGFRGWQEWVKTRNPENLKYWWAVSPVSMSAFQFPRFSVSRSDWTG
jgi:hypothetical protein